MDPITLALANKYTAETAEGMGAVQGKPGPQGPVGPTGPQGAPGEDGFSPTVSVSEITGGHNVTITDANGPHSFDVMDGESGSGSGEDSFITIKDQTITTPAQFVSAIGLESYTGCIHAINTAILDTNFANDIVWVMYRRISGTYYLSFVTADGHLEDWTSAASAESFSRTRKTEFLAKDETELAEGTTFIGDYPSPPEIGFDLSVQPDWFIGKKPEVGRQYRGKIRTSDNKWYDMTVNALGTSDHEGSLMYNIRVVSVTEIGKLPAGGTTGQILTKKTNADYDTEWTSSMPVKPLTTAQYNALTDAEKQSDILYIITDDN